MEIETYNVESDVKGPHVLILGGVHGNEICGFKAILGLKDSLNLIKGKVTFVIANKRAIEKNVRFVEKDLNRCFYKRESSDFYEEKVADEIMAIMDSADFCLDIHSSNTKDTMPFQICQSEIIEESNRLPVTKVLSGISGILSNSSSGYMASIGKKGIGVECGNVEDLESIELAKKCILEYLSSFEMIESNKEIPNPKKEVFEVFEKFVCKHSFSLAKEFPDFYFLSKGNLIGFDGDTQIKAQKDSYIVFARNRDKSQGAFILCEKKL